MILKNRRIFIVEDNMHNRVIFNVTLSKHGAKVNFDRWGNTAISQMKMMGQIDLIILDLMLEEGISGFDIFEKIRAIPEFNAVPIIAVSAIEASPAIAKAQKMGFSGFIAKPIDDVLFPRQIASILEGEKLWFAGERSLR